MRSSSGISVAREAALRVAAGVAFALVLAPAPTAAIDFDAIFYRARAGFDFCYDFTGTAGWSLRAFDGGRITHAPEVACPSDGLGEGPLAATRDCVGGSCHADCAAFVRRAWVAGAEALLRPLSAAAGGNCADPSDYGAERYVHADASLDTIVDALADARPGDWCSHADHVVMLLRRASPNGSRWTTWEANSAAVGIGQGSVLLDPTWLRRIARDDCHWTLGPNANGTWREPERAWRNSGCWHPNAERTGPPVELALLVGTGAIPQDGVIDLDVMDDATFGFRRPESLPALADYLLWVRWRKGGTDAAPTWDHRLVRVPAFSRRTDAERRLASFPEIPPGARDFPLDVDEASVLQIAYASLATAPVATPMAFVDPTTGALADDWQPGRGLTPVVPERFRDTGLVLDAGRSYAWRVRVERYGELASDGRTRVAVVPSCAADATGAETIDYCRDPRWSEEQRFTLVCSPVDDSCPRDGPTHGEVCGPAPTRPEDRWTSGCAEVTLGAQVANAGDFIEATVTTHSGICAGAGVWAVPSDYAIFQGEEVVEAATSLGVYDFCTDGPEQPVPAYGVATVVRVPDDWSGVVRFHVPEAGGGCIDYIGPDSGGTCCMYSGDCPPHGEFEGPMVVAGGYGGTHGWSTVRMFTVAPARIAADDGTP